MTKAEYLEKLQEKLERFGQELQEDILEDYRQHFAEGESEGKSEEEIIEELGNIEEMIRELSGEELNESLNDNVGWKQEMKIGLDKIVQSMPEAGSELKDSLMKLVHKIPDISVNIPDIQLNREKGGDRTRQEGLVLCEENVESSEGCKAVVIDGKVADVTVGLSEDDRIHIHYVNDSEGAGKALYSLYHYEEKGVFYAGVKKEQKAEDDTAEKASQNGREEIKVTLFGRTIVSYGKVSNFSSNDVDISLEVMVPQGMRRVELKTESGDISVSEISSEGLRVVSASGDLEMESVEAGNVEVSTASGDVSLDECRFKESKINTASGDISGEGLCVEQGNFVAASGDISLDGAKVGTGTFNTGSGDIELQDGCCRVVSCRTGSGDIDLCTEAEEYDCNAGSGDISVTAETQPRRIGMHTGSGDVDLELNNAEGLEVTVKSFGGDADIDWKGARYSVQKHGTFSFGAGGCKVDATSGSGDIQITAR